MNSLLSSPCRRRIFPDEPASIYSCPFRKQGEQNSVMWTFYKIDNHLQISNTYIPAPAFSPNGKKRTLFRYEHALIPLD